MNGKSKTNISKFLSLVLRHQPEKIGLELDENGWSDVEALLSKMAEHRFAVSLDELKEVVEENDKQRFSFNGDLTKIRANQGHSVDVELNLSVQVPPDYLYHGTVDKFVPQIRMEGLKKMNRHHVHLSKDKETAVKVGNRRGEAVILLVRSRQMYDNGMPFFLSENGVWLTDHVPPMFIEFSNTDNI